MAENIGGVHLLKLDMITAYLHAQFLHLKERNDEGATAVEYGLMVALIAVAIILAVTAFGTRLSDIFTALSTKFKVTT